MPNKSDFKQLKVWQESMSLVEDIYRCTKDLPHEEKFGLADQLRRAAVSIPSNIAEGQARATDKDFARFLSMARGSVAEVETQLLLCQRLGFLPEEIVNNVLQRLHNVSKMIRSLKKYLKECQATNDQRLQAKDYRIQTTD